MNVKKTVSMLCSVVFIGAFAISVPVTASEGRLAFKGAMVTGGCDAHASFDQARPKPAPARLGAQNATDSGGFRSVCREQNLPMDVHYADGSSTHVKGHAGVVTLTYQ